MGGRYQVEKLLGKGGFGAVYLVRDQRVQHNLFALKEVIDPNIQERKRFVFEADLLRRLDHPALPRVYHVFEDDKNERAYMLMDYVEGSNLEVLRRQQSNMRFSVPQVLSIIAPIMNAVYYLHNQQPPVIHRDIKPSNIIVPSSRNEAVLVDFGIAKEFDPDSTTTAVRHASPGYAAPEQYGIGTNTRTDIYGLGATIYTFLTGVVPTDAFYRAMAVDMNDRFPTVQDFWQDLIAPPVDFHSAGPLVIPGPTSAQSSPASINTPLPTVHNAPTFVMQRRSQDRRGSGVLLLLLFALFVGIAAVALLLPSILGQQHNQTSITPTVPVTHNLTPVATPGLTPSPVVTQTPPVSSGYPNVAGTYKGTIIDELGSISGNMSLLIRQKQANIRGNFTVGGGRTGNGPFTGYVTNKDYIQFIVQSRGVNPLFFYGSVQANGDLGGNYCSLDNTGHCNANVGGYGTWSVLPA